MGCPAPPRKKKRVCCTRYWGCHKSTRYKVALGLARTVITARGGYSSVIYHVPGTGIRCHWGWRGELYCPRVILYHLPGTWYWYKITLGLARRVVLPAGDTLLFSRPKTRAGRLPEPMPYLVNCNNVYTCRLYTAIIQANKAGTTRLPDVYTRALVVPPPQNAHAGSYSQVELDLDIASVSGLQRVGELRPGCRWGLVPGFGPCLCLQIHHVQNGGQREFSEQTGLKNVGFVRNRYEL